jgi:predicted metal-dependent enzyme (double-stranded beta helix superfamily)
MTPTLPLTLHSFAVLVRETLHKDDSPRGREKVATLLSSALKDSDFMETLFDDASPERKVLYEDPQLGFCILAHRYTDARNSPPHGHGPSWAIYGQLDGATVMSDWVLVEAATADRPGKVKKLREYTLTPGLTHVYNEGDMHAPSRAGSTRLVRIEGTNLERVPRVKYEAIAAE